MRSFTINANDAGQRMDKFLTKAVPLLPKNLLYKYLRTKRIKHNGKRCEISTRLTEGDVVELYINDEFFEAPSCTHTFLHAGSGLDVLYEDAHLLLVNKPAGLVVHEDESGTADTLIHRILKYLYQKGEYCPEAENSFVPALCNRIDRNTTGIVICAKDAPTLRVMNDKIRDREMEKRYLCLVHGTPSPLQDTVTLFMQKQSAEKRIRVSDKPLPDGRKMITKYRTLCHDRQHALLEVELVTGRTHQIRATMDHIGHPIVGEGKYGVAANTLGFKHQALCAYSLTFRFVGEPTHLEYLNNRTFRLQENPFARYIRT